MLPNLVIFGRPNVGKSTLFNRLIKRKAAIVADIPGVTRDNKGLKANLGKLEFILYDTAGFELVDKKNELSKSILENIKGIDTSTKNKTTNVRKTKKERIEMVGDIIEKLALEIGVKNWRLGED